MIGPSRRPIPPTMTIKMQIEDQFVNKRPRVTPPPQIGSIAYRADRRQDPAPIHRR
jgi:hypothetical protein